MYILFINSCGRFDFFFPAQFSNNSNKKLLKKNCPTHGLTQPNPTHVGWVELDWRYVMGWIRLNFF